MSEKGIVLITGLSGFTGKFVGELFEAADYNIAGLDNVAVPDQKNIIACDLLDKNAVKNVVNDISPIGVIHLAGISFPAHEPASDFYEINTIGTCNLLDAIVSLPYKIQKLIVASSANVYGDTNVDLISEDTPCNPVNHYSASKLAMEYLVKTYDRKIPTIIVRPFNYTGPTQRVEFLVPKIVHHFKEKKSEIRLGNLDVEKDFLDVRDVSRAYFELFQSEFDSEVFNICSGRVSSIRNVLQIMSELTGLHIEVFVDKKFIRANEIPTMKGNNQKLVEWLNFKPSLSLRDTLSDMLNE